MWLLRLCRTVEYHPFQIEHWLSSLHKTKRKFYWRWKAVGSEFQLETSHDFSNAFEGSTSIQTHISRQNKPQFYAKSISGALLPLKRYRQMEDRFNKIRIYPTEIALQILKSNPEAHLNIEFEPIPDKWRHHALQWAKHSWFKADGKIEQWESQYWFSKGWMAWLGLSLRMIRPYRNIKHSEEKTETLHEREDPQQATLDKLSRPLFRVRVSSSENIQNFLSVFNWPYLGHMRLSRKTNELILSAEELAGILSPPRLNQSISIQCEPCRAIAPNPNALKLSEEIVKRHRYVIGKTGTGKSTLLERFFMEDIRRGGTAILMDPHGDLAERIYQNLSENEHERLVVLDADNNEQIPSYNPIECAHPNEAPRQSSMLLEVFQIMAQGSWGPRLEYILRNSLLTLTLSPNRTLLDLPLLLQNQQLNKSWTQTVGDMELQRFWRDEFWAMSDKSRQEAIAPILNKVGPLLSHPTLRNMLAQPKSKLNWSRVINENKIMLIPLSKGRLGDDLSRIMGLLFLAGIQNALAQQIQRKTSERSLVHLTLDECHHFATPTLMSMLSESRKYGLALTLAHQYLEQMPIGQQKAILGNVGSMAIFQTCPEDADILAPFLNLEANDLMNTEPLQFYWKQKDVCRMELKKASPQEQKSKNAWEDAQKSISRNRAHVEAKVRDRYTRQSHSPP